MKALNPLWVDAGTRLRGLDSAEGRTRSGRRGMPELRPVDWAPTRPDNGRARPVGETGAYATDMPRGKMPAA